MARTLWKGTLSFGLVTIPVGLYTATEDKSPSFNQLRESDHSRIGYKRVAKADDSEVGWDEMVKGYEYERDRYVVFTADELNALKPKSSRLIDIEHFVPIDQIDPIYYDKPYFLAPEPAGAKAYALLAAAMTDRDSVAIARVTMRDKEHLATLRVKDGIFVLETMHWPDEIRPFSLDDVGIDDIPEPRAAEVKMAETLIENLTEDFDPGRFKDSYRERLEEAVAAKVEGKEITVVDEEEPATVLDLMEALKQSVAATKKGASEESSKRKKAS